MADALALAVLLATILVRQAFERRLGRGSLEGAARGTGAGSVVFWYCAYSVLLALAGSRLWGASLGAHEWAGYATLWAGVALRQLSLRALGAHYHVLILVRESHRLIDTGPYRFLRHPLHLGLHLEMLGLAVLAGDAIGWLALAASVVVLLQRNRREEVLLRDFFGAAYDAYRERAWDLVDAIPRRAA